MKIGFDGRYAEGNLVGVGKYIVSLINQIAKKDIECVVFYSQKAKRPLSGKNISAKILPSINRYTFEQINLPKALTQEKVDVYHATGNMGIPLFPLVPAVLTVHDIIPILTKDYFKYSKYKFLSKFSYLFRLKTSLSKAEKIITVSEFTRKTLVDNLGVKPSKIKVIYSGAPQVSRQSNKLPSGLKSGQYILNQGGMDIRKNLNCLIRAFAGVIPKAPKLKLVITGGNDDIEEGLRKEAKILGVEDSVLFTDYVEEEILWSLIRQANCICYPSLIEGFGGPVLEGYAAGVPVITSKTSSLLEVSGQAAYLVDPKREEEITRAILEVIKDKNLRKKLIDRGKQRIRQFSWKKTGEKIINIYKEVKR